MSRRRRRGESQGNKRTRKPGRVCERYDVERVCVREKERKEEESAELSEH